MFRKEQEVDRLTDGVNIKFFKAKKETIEPLLKTLEEVLENDYFVARTSDYITSDKDGECHIFVYVEPKQAVIAQ